MELRNKKTGEIGELQITEKHCAVAVGNGTASCGIEIYSSLESLTKEWEDYEEPKEYWYIDTTEGAIVEHTCEQFELTDKERKEIGNYFSSREEAEKAVEKLKAWKRLKDKGFRFDGWTIDDGLRISICTNMGCGGIYDDDKKEMKSYLDSLFGGEE